MQLDIAQTLRLEMAVFSQMAYGTSILDPVSSGVEDSDGRNMEDAPAGDTLDSARSTEDTPAGDTLDSARSTEDTSAGSTLDSTGSAGDTPVDDEQDSAGNAGDTPASDIQSPDESACIGDMKNPARSVGNTGTNPVRDVRDTMTSKYVCLVVYMELPLISKKKNQQLFTYTT